MEIERAQKSVWITGTGVVSCLGRSTSEVWQNLLRNRTGIREGVGQVPGEIGSEQPAHMASHHALGFAMSAIRQALEQAGWSQLNLDDGIILATTTGQILIWDQALIRRASGLDSQQEFRQAFNQQPLGELLRSVRFELGHQGPCTLLTSACSASTQALALGAMWIRQGRVRRCLVVGVEVLCDLTVEGFRSLQLLSSQGCMPFDVNRQGINLAEGAGVICLDSQANTPLARLSGFGLSSDGHHMTGPHPDGEGSWRAMRDALNVAGLMPSEVSWVHAHGTGSKQNDLSESRALHRLFGEVQPFVSSTKWSHGHALAASGTLEVTLVVQAIQNQLILHTRGMERPDPGILVNHPRQDLQFPLRHVLKSTLGFGGSNAALVISHVDARVS